MKIAYSHLVKHIAECPSIEQVSDSLFQLGHEHEIDGNIFDMEFTPNRGDCLSINGLLRDLATFYTIKLNQDIYNEKLDQLEIDFENLSEDICPQISFLKLEIEQVPESYKGSLNNYFIELGLNKNNFFTDISNYLSYETGQPTHCYDANRMEGKLLFQETSKNEIFETLLDKKINLTNKNAVFLLNNKVINLAGIVGGKDTSCSANTKTVLVECAFFQPEAIIGKSIKYDIQSDASHKFERGVDPKCQDMVLRRLINIVSQHANIKNMSMISYNFKDNPSIKIPINIQKINEIVGINISEKEYLNYLSKLGFIIENNFIVVPSFRNDIKTQNDLAEEVARVIGYDNINISNINIPRNKNEDYKNIENKLRYFLLDNGFYEVINAPFVSLPIKGAIKVDNPLDSNREFLRTNVTNSLIDNLLYNERRQKDSIKLFEISDVYSFDDGVIRNRKLSIIGSGRVGLNFEDFSKKINKKYFNELFYEILPSQKFSFHTISRDKLITKVKNEIIGCEINIDEIPSEILSYKEQVKLPSTFIQYTPISELPYSKRDLSFSIQDFSKCKLLERYILEFQNDLLKEAFVFDYFYNEKKAEIKIGFRLIFQSTESTIKESQITNIMDVIIKHTNNIEGINIPGLKYSRDYN